MSIRHLIAAIALGLAFFSSALGQTDEQTGELHGSTPEQQRPTQTLPIPVPVEIIESDAATETREREEAEARQRDIEDLIAQQGMNAATRAMNAATQDMRDYSFYSTVFVGVGTVLLFATLFLTWQANRAAVTSVKVIRDMSQRELRAYVGIKSGAIKPISRTDDQFQVFVRIEIQNWGQTPAYSCRNWMHVEVHERSWSDFTTSAEQTFESDSILGPNCEFNVDKTITVTDTELAAAKDGTLRIFAWGRVEYSDAFGRPRYFRFQSHNGDWIDREKAWPVQPSQSGYQAD